MEACNSEGCKERTTRQCKGCEKVFCGLHSREHLKVGAEHTASKLKPFIMSEEQKQASDRILEQIKILDDDDIGKIHDSNILIQEIYQLERELQVEIDAKKAVLLKNLSMTLREVSEDERIELENMCKTFLMHQTPNIDPVTDALKQYFENIPAKKN